jgi:hypothetical protein
MFAGRFKGEIDEEVDGGRFNAGRLFGSEWAECKCADHRETHDVEVGCDDAWRGDYRVVGGPREGWNLHDPVEIGRWDENSSALASGR